MKNIIKTSYLLLFLCMTAVITACKNKINPGLSPEQIAYCKALKSQILAETGNAQQARKAYKQAWNKIYQSSPEFKAHKKKYFETYKKNEQSGNVIISKSTKSKNLNKIFGKRSKNKNYSQSVGKKTLNSSSVSIMNIDQIEEQSLEKLPHLVSTKDASLPVNEVPYKNIDLLDNILDELDQFIAHYNESDNEFLSMQEKISPVYDFDTCFNPEIYNDELSIETHE